MKSIGGAAPESIALGALSSAALGAVTVSPTVQIISAIALALYPLIGIIARQLRPKNNPVIQIPKKESK